MAARSARPGGRDDDLAVEPARTAQRGVQGIRPVGGGQHHDPGGVLEPVHLGEQLVEGLLPFVAAGYAAVVAASAEDIDLVDEHDRRARVRACSNRSRTRAAPRPTNISTKPEPDTDKKGT